MTKLSGLVGCLILALLCGKEARAQADLGIIAPQASGAVEASHVFRSAGSGTLVGFSAVNASAAAATWVLILDSPTVPAPGAVTPIDFFQLSSNASPPNNSIHVNYAAPVRVLTGLVFLCSSAASPFTFTSTTSCAFSVQAQ